MDNQTLATFLIDSNNAGYAGGEEKKWIKEDDGSTSIPYVKGDWRSHDNFFGGEPYGGRIVVFYQNNPVWIMIYYGWVAEGVDTDPVYTILRGALKQMPKESPYRGPKEYKENDLTYTNTWQGDIERFSGEEQITQNTKTIYKANYMGGLVDQRQGL